MPTLPPAQPSRSVSSKSLRIANLRRRRTMDRVLLFGLRTLAGVERMAKANANEIFDRPSGTNGDAPVIGSGELEISAPPERVWAVLTDFDHWPAWNADVKSMQFKGPVAPGSEFRWKAGPGTISSRIERVEPPLLIAWTGNTLGIKAIHVWMLKAQNGSTLVRTEESYDGLVARILRRPLQKTLDGVLERGLRYLKAEVERQGAAHAP
jgi:hypothetical protein